MDTQLARPCSQQAVARWDMHRQPSPAAISSCTAQPATPHLHRLAKAHVISQDAVQAVVMQRHQPAQPRQLVLPQAGQAGGGLAGDVGGQALSQAAPLPAAVQEALVKALRADCCGGLLGCGGSAGTRSVSETQCTSLPANGMDLCARQGVPGQ
jgi:hypothetical protein